MERDRQCATQGGAGRGRDERQQRIALAQQQQNLRSNQQNAQTTQNAPYGNNVNSCLSLENRASAISTQSLVNKCSFAIEATWCFEGGSPSDSCSRGFRNLWTIGAGATYPLQSKTITQLKVGACRGANTLKVTGPLVFECAVR